MTLDGATGGLRYPVRGPDRVSIQVNTGRPADTTWCDQSSGVSPPCAGSAPTPPCLGAAGGWRPWGWARTPELSPGRGNWRGLES